MRLERMFVAACEESNALNAAADKHCTRDIMADFYADCIRCDVLESRKPKAEQRRVDFAKINAAILARWPRGLEYVKRKAWKLVEGKG